MHQIKPIYRMTLPEEEQRVAWTASEQPKIERQENNKRDGDMVTKGTSTLDTVNAVGRESTEQIFLSLGTEIKSHSLKEKLAYKRGNTRTLLSSEELWESSPDQRG